jgi:hypothetical protein
MLSLLLAASLGSTVAIACLQSAGGTTALAGHPQLDHLKLGEEMPPPRPEEEAATKLLVDGTIGLMKKQQGRPVQRDQHPKHHGCVRAKFVVPDGLPGDLRVGLFARPKTYDAVIRFSMGAAQVDNVRDAHGMAIKLLGVEGPSLLADEADAGTQDFILIDHPVFFAKDPKRLLEFSGARAAIEKAKAAGDTATIDAVKRQFSKELGIFEATRTLGVPSPLEMTYFSMVPSRLGNQAVKYIAVAAQENRSGRPDLTEASPKDALQAAMIDYLTTQGKSASFAFQVQLQNDPIHTPVEDATVRWTSAPRTVATITIDAQEFASAQQLRFCEDLAYTPWHSLEAHRPMGGINRARRPVYEATSKFRHEQNQAPRKEPTGSDLDRIFNPVPPP